MKNKRSFYGLAGLLIVPACEERLEEGGRAGAYKTQCNPSEFSTNQSTCWFFRDRCSMTGGRRLFLQDRQENVKVCFGLKGVSVSSVTDLPRA